MHQLNTTTKTADRFQGSCPTRIISAAYFGLCLAGAAFKSFICNNKKIYTS